MYLSSLMINVGDNPDRPRPGRLWLRNLYRVHQRLCMAFPSQAKKQDDPKFLKPYEPEDFIPNQNKGKEPTEDTSNETDTVVHVPRNARSGFLYRVDPLPGTGRAMILVQSARKPDWDYAFQNANYLLSAQPLIKYFDPKFKINQHLRFRLVANPVRKVSHKSLDAQGKPFEPKWLGKDVPVSTVHLDRWLKRRAEPEWTPPKNSEHVQAPPGFRIYKITNIQTGYVYVNKECERGHGRRIRLARYEGELIVTDPDNFRDSILRGIGPGKAFGFGLLSVAPC